MGGIYLLLGTNLGDRKINLELARTLISEQVGAVKAVSSIYKSAAWGKTDQPDFLNQVIQVSTSLMPYALLGTIQEIESQMGRVRKEKWGERLIDIDILYYYDIIVQSQVLSIPHPRIQDRRFTLEPLVELMPEYLHPVIGLSNKALLMECKDVLEVELYNGK